MDLNDNELAEEIAKVLSCENKNISQNLVIWSFREGTYVPVQKTSNVVTIFEHEGTAIHIETAEAKAQIARDGDTGFDPRMHIPGGGDMKSGSQTGATTPDIDKGGEEGDGDDNEEAEEEGEEDAAVEVEAEVEESKPVGAPGGPKKKLTNQFNFCERAALTYQNPSRSVETQTVPPPRSTFGANVVQWNIYDSYNEDYERIKREKEKEMLKEKKPGLQKHAEMKRGDAKTKAVEEFNRRYFQKCQILERMVNQNIFDEIAHGREL